MSTTVCAQPHKRVVVLAVVRVLATVCAQLHKLVVILTVVGVLNVESAVVML